MERENLSEEREATGERKQVKVEEAPICTANKMKREIFRRTKEGKDRTYPENLSKEISLQNKSIYE